MPVAPTNPVPTQRKLVLALLLVLVTLAVYNPVARNGFVKFDDDHYVTDNPRVQAGPRLDDNRLGIHLIRSGKLASANLAFVCSRFPTLSNSLPPAITT